MESSQANCFKGIGVDVKLPVLKSALNEFLKGSCKVEDFENVAGLFIASDVDEFTAELTLMNIQKLLLGVENLEEVGRCLKIFRKFPECMQDSINLLAYFTVSRIVDYTNDDLIYLTDALKSLEELCCDCLKSIKELLIVNAMGRLEQLIKKFPANESIPRLLYSLTHSNLPEPYKTSLEAYKSQYDLSQFSQKSPEIFLPDPENSSLTPYEESKDPPIILPTNEEDPQLTTQNSLILESDTKQILDSLPISSWSQITFIEHIQRLNSKGIEVVKAAITINNKQVLVAVKTHLSKTKNPRISMQADYMAIVQDSNFFLKLFGAFWDSHKDLLRFNLIMELAEQTLSQRVHQWNIEHKPKAFRESEAYNAALQLINAMTVLNQKDISHRDIKPDNIFITADNCYKIADFDISQKIIRNAFGVTEVNLNASLSGTQNFLSPELFALAKGVDVKAGIDYNKSDVYSMGITILSMVTLKDFACWNSYSSKLQAHVNEIIDEEVENVELRVLVKKMMTVDPVDRPKFRELLLCTVPTQSTYISEFD